MYDEGHLFWCGNANEWNVLTFTFAAGAATWYSLAGQRVAKPAKGLYIVNGKKVLVR